MQVKELIEAAEKVAGSPTAIAHILGIKPPIVFAWKSGSRTCSAEDRALLADIAGVDPLPEIAAAMLERFSGKPQADRLATVLHRRLEGVRNF